MPDDEDRPRPKIAHELGAVLDTLSVGELEERVALLQREIVRLEAAKKAKRNARDLAGSVFKT